MTETPEFTRTCAWTGEDSAGKHYILTSTQGQEIVSEAALRGPADDHAAQLEHLTRAVNQLTRRVRQLEGADDQGAAEAASPVRRPRKRAAKVPAQREEG